MRFLLAFACLVLPLSLSGAAGAARGPSHVVEGQAWRAPQGATEICGVYPWVCGDSGAAATLQPEAVLRLAREVNSSVNRRIRPQSDAELYGVTEKWTLPIAGRGDCEDYALLKMKLLLEQGVPARDLVLAMVVTEKYVPHIVLILRTEEADYFLDNMTDAMLPWYRSGYTVLSMQSPADKKQWSAVFQGPLVEAQQAAGTTAEFAASQRVASGAPAAAETAAEPGTSSSLASAEHRR